MTTVMFSDNKVRIGQAVLNRVGTGVRGADKEGLKNVQLFARVQGFTLVQYLDPQ